ncbi:MAG: GatB/YqeY domain-containing protein [Rhodospirillales bacterium]|nr:GatB/YqeY domain-containing protein [Alphaproteobacteria bacterium]MBL6947201.1 GatB/YqeY domain-containing protein [Rhodospirillales bacterium]
MLRTRIADALKTAMKSKDAKSTATLRLIMAALKDRDIAARSKGNKDGILEDEVLGMLQSMIKQRRESISLYEKGGRMELAQQEAEEIAVIEEFLPEQMSEDDMTAAIDTVIGETEAASLKDMGRVMAALKDRHAGSMDFSKASALVKSRLS